LKVLVKFWLLQVGEAPMARLIEHFAQARYARIVQQRHFGELTFEQMLELTVRQLCAAGAVVLEGAKLRNVDGVDAD
jgi:hypothetical protein